MSACVCTCACVLVLACMHALTQRLYAHLYNSHQITYLNGIGCSAAVVGCFWYSHLRMEANKKPALPTTATNDSSR